MSWSKKTPRRVKRGAGSTFQIGAGYQPGATGEGNQRPLHKRRSKRIKTLKPAGSARNAENPVYKGSSVLSEKTWTEENGFLAVSRGLKRRPLASAGGATQLMAFLCSAERGRFFVPA